KAPCGACARIEKVGPKQTEAKTAALPNNRADRRSIAPQQLGARTAQAAAPKLPATALDVLAGLRLLLAVATGQVPHTFGPASLYMPASRAHRKSPRD